MYINTAGIKLQSALYFSFGAYPVPVILLFEASQREMRLGKLLIQLDSLNCG